MKPYLKDRLLEERPEGFVIIRPVDVEPSVPLACPTCSHVLRTSDDETSYLEFGCCDRCARLWAHPRRSAWISGWRPSVEQVTHAELDRLPLTFALDAK